LLPESYISGFEFSSKPLFFALMSSRRLVRKVCLGLQGDHIKDFTLLWALPGEYTSE